jgi:hypothetical protein
VSVLLTDEAVRAGAAKYRPGESAISLIREDIELFLRYHAAEGREALVEAVARIIFAEHITADQIPEAVVTALVGEPRS